MFLKIAAFFTIALAVVLTLNAPLREKILGRIKIRLFPPKHIPEEERAVAVLPPEGENTSVETALNSRCCSDNTGNQRWIHWGMFDNETKLSSEQIDRVIRLATIPRFTNHRVEFSADGNILTFSIDNHLSGVERDRAMIESGMQQQAVGLVCAALGVGMVFQNLGRDGTVLSDDVFGNVKFRLGPMRPGYDGTYWTEKAPRSEKSWQRGNLPDPHRKSTTPLVSILKKPKITHTGTQAVSRAVLGQLLWAARGRTPHFYKSKPWGMTIPFWTDRIQASSVYMWKNGTIYEYINWENDRPTHSIRELGPFHLEHLKSRDNSLVSHQTGFIISRNDRHNRALWEIGYVLTNFLVQARALNISYTAVLLKKDQEKSLQLPSIVDPMVACFV